jgi:hypothetical protein
LATNPRRVLTLRTIRTRIKLDIKAEKNATPAIIKVSFVAIG